MTPIEIIVKEFLRRFVTRKMDEAKAKTGNMAVPGIIIRPGEEEKFIDEMWVSINKDQQEYNGTKG